MLVPTSAFELESFEEDDATEDSVVGVGEGASKRRLIDYDPTCDHSCTASCDHGGVHGTTGGTGSTRRRWRATATCVLAS